MAQITMSDMLKAGLHFGHQTRRWNPKMKQFILTQRNGIHIINLFKSLDMIDKAYDFIKATVAHNGTVLFVGTKKQAQEAVSNQATRVNMPYVSERWLGGMLTNFQTVSKRVSRLKELEEMDFTDVRGSGLTKKELLLLEREKDKLAKQLGGIRNMNRTPSAMFVVDVNKEALAVEEAHKLGIPVVAIVDTNADPESVEYPIAANDDAIRGIELLTSLMADAVAEGLLERSGKAAKAEGEAEQPMAAWEKELLTEGAPAADAPAEAEAEAKPRLSENIHYDGRCCASHSYGTSLFSRGDKSMAAITAALIKQVREETGAGMMDVKKALTEAEGDVARAKEIIRAKAFRPLVSAKDARLRKAPSPPRSWSPPMARPVTPSN